MAVLTEAGVGTAATGWVDDEIRRALEEGKTVLPCVIGNFLMHTETQLLLRQNRLHMVFADRIEDLHTLEAFRIAIDGLIKELSD